MRSSYLLIAIVAQAVALIYLLSKPCVTRIKEEKEKNEKDWDDLIREFRDARSSLGALRRLQERVGESKTHNQYTLLESELTQAIHRFKVAEYNIKERARITNKSMTLADRDQL